MIFSIHKIYTVFAVIVLIVLSMEPAQAGFNADLMFTPYNLMQRHEYMRDFELTARQARRKVEHTLVNYLLGQTVDQYLDFDEDDASSRKSIKRLKLHLNHHRATFVYQYNFY